MEPARPHLGPSSCLTRSVSPNSLRKAIHSHDWAAFLFWMMTRSHRDIGLISGMLRVHWFSATVHFAILAW